MDTKITSIIRIVLDVIFFRRKYLMILAMPRCYFIVVSILFSMICYGQDCDTPTAFATLENGQVKFTIPNSGDLWWSNTEEDQYIFPQTLGKRLIYSGSIDFGAMDINGEIKVAAAAYHYHNDFDYRTGPLNFLGRPYPEFCDEFDQIWVIYRNEIQEFLENFQSNSFIPESIKNWPGKNNPVFDLFELPTNKQLAPFIDLNGNGNYEPNLGEYPCMKGFGMAWWIFNDVSNHNYTGGSPLQIEVKASAYLFDNDSEFNLQNHSIYEFEITNYGQDLFDFYTSIFVNQNLGYYADDYVGCSIDNNLAFGYNGDAFDNWESGFGDDIPTFGVKLLENSLLDSDTLMTSFFPFINDYSSFNEAVNDTQYYNHMRGLWKTGKNITYGGNPIGGDSITTYMYPANPNDQSEGTWSECSDGITPDDRRFKVNSGSGALPKGESFKFAFAVVAKEGEYFEYPCPDITPLEEEAQQVQDFYDNYYDPCPVFENPLSVVSQLQKNVQINIRKGQIDIYNESEKALGLIIYNLNGLLVDHQTILPGYHSLPMKNELLKGVYVIEVSSKTESFVQKLTYH